MAEQKIDAPKVLDSIMKEVAATLNPYGFRKHGRTLHRFVDGDVSQAITFQLGQAYLNQAHRLGVEMGIRVPESANRSFGPDAVPRKYYSTSACNIRGDFGQIEGGKSCWYDLRKPMEPITADVLRQIRDVVLPAFEALHDREAILRHRREFPNLDALRHLILLDEAMIHGRRGDLAAAKACLCQHWRECAEELQDPCRADATKAHLRYIEDLAKTLG